jgi:D-alanine--poly(phosphoribitol) ligase subunit 2
MDTKERIHKQVQTLAKGLGRATRVVGDDEELPKSGLLDSASILELILWVENEFDIEIDQSDLSLDNFGTIRKMVQYIEARRQGKLLHDTW